MNVAERDQTVAALFAAGHSVRGIARDTGIPRTTIQDIKRRMDREKPFEVPAIPDLQMPDDQLVEHMCRQFERRQAHHDAKKWRPINIKIDGPIGIQWFGDPHVDDDGCDWPLLRRHVDLVNRTEGLFGANIGDQSNNWVGRLSRLYANQETSHATAVQLVAWLMRSIDWLLVIRGNHDLWSGAGDLLQWMAQGQGPVADWQAQIKLVFPNGREAKVWAAHNFPGNSQWNPLHGNAKRAQLSGEAHLYISGHLHNWMATEHEDPFRGLCYWLARARGYKVYDDHAEQLGHQPQKHGAAITSIIDPYADGPSFLRCYSDPEEAAEILTWKRAKFKAGKRTA